MKPVLADMFKKAKYRAIVEVLEKDTRVKLPFNEFVMICKNNSVDEAEAKKLATSFHESGKFLHYAHSKDLNGYVLLKPDELAMSFARLLDLKGNFTKEFVAKKQEELNALALEAKAFEEKEQQFARRAARNADTWLVAGLALLFAQGFAVARLTWWELSWDIMEPVTYMMTFATAFGGYVYFNMTKIDYTYEGLRTRMINKRINKYLRREGLDPERYAKIKAQMADVRNQIQHPEVSLLVSGL